MRNDNFDDRFLRLAAGLAVAVAACGEAPPDEPVEGDAGAVESGAADDGVDDGVDDDGATATGSGNADTGPSAEDDSSDAADDSDEGNSTDGDDESGGSDDGAETGEPPEIPPECEGSVLADVVAGMAPGSWATLPENPSLDALEMSYALLYWADSAVFDAATRQLHWVGGPGTCCANPAIYQRISYDELSDTWSIEATPYEGSGHAYDGNALDPNTGAHFFARFNDEDVHRYADSTWTDLPPLPIAPATTMGLTWFPEMDGLVYIGGYGEAAFFDGASWSAMEAPGDDWGSYNVFSQYSAPAGVLWLGGGNGANDVNYTMDGTGTLTQRQPSPVALGNGGALHAVDPATGNFLVLDRDIQAWWEFDAVADVWTALPMPDAPNLSSGSQFHVGLPHCGVTLFLQHYWENRSVHLYRHQ